MNPHDSEMHTTKTQGSTEGESSSARRPDRGSSRKEQAGKGTTSQRTSMCPWMFTILALDGTNATGRETLRMVERSDWNLRKGVTNWPTLMEMRDLTTDKGHPSFEGWTSDNQSTWACVDRWMQEWDEKMGRAPCQEC